MLVLLLALPALRADDKPQDKKPPTPQEEYRALAKEHPDAQQPYFSAMRAAKTDDERKAAAEKAPKPEQFAPKFIELAEKNPKDPVAVDALTWIITHTRGNIAKAEREKAFDLLMRD